MILQYCMYMCTCLCYPFICTFMIKCICVEVKFSEILNNVISLVACVFSVFSSDVASYIEV